MVQAPQRREIFGADLVEPEFADVLEPVRSEVADGVSTNQLPRRLRKKDLAAVRSGRDPRGAVHVDADIPLVGPRGLAGVDPDPHSNGPVCGEGSLCLDRCRKRVGRCLERDEERVPLRVDLYATVALEGGSQQVAMLYERLCVALAQLLQQPRGADDVGEQQRDGPARQRAHRR